MEVNLLDAVIGIIALASVITGYKKGMVGALVGIVSTAAGLGAAFIYRREAADYLEQNYGVITSLATFLEKHLVASSGLPDQPGWLTSLAVVGNGLAALHRQIAEIADGLVVALCFLVLYMVGSLLVSLLGLFLEKIVHRKLMGRINQGAGAIIILGQNVLIMAALVGILSRPIELGAQVGIKGAAAVAALMQGSQLVPILALLFTWLQEFIGKMI